MTATDIHDITWSDMTNAGIDTDKVRRVPTQLGVDEYVFQTETVKVAFGPCVDMENGGTCGWSITTYDREGDGWEQSTSDWFETESAVLAEVAKYAAL